MDATEVNILSDKLDLLINLMAFQVSSSRNSIEAKAVLLNSLGLKPFEIAKICGTTANTISVRLAEAKKKTKKKRKQ